MRKPQGKHNKRKFHSFNIFFPSLSKISIQTQISQIASLQGELQMTKTQWQGEVATVKSQWQSEVSTVRQQWQTETTSVRTQWQGGKVSKIFLISQHFFSFQL